MIHGSSGFPLTRGKIVEKPRTARLRQRYPIYWRAVYIVEERGHRTLPASVTSIIPTPRRSTRELSPTREGKVGRGEAL